MKHLLVASLFMNAANAASIANLKVATETGSGTVQIIGAIGAFAFGLALLFKRTGGEP